MSQERAWEERAREWARFARSPEHDHFFWHFNGPRFLDLVPPPGRITLDVACGEGRLGRLDCYFDARPWLWSSQHTGIRLTLPGVHRPLEAYTRALERGEFLLEILREPRPTKHQIARYPESARWQRVPCFVHIRAIKMGPSSI